MEPPPITGSTIGGCMTIRIRLLWATGQRTYIDVDQRARTIRHRSTSLQDTGETDVDGIDTYAEAGCGWTRVHANHSISSVVATPQGKFAAWAAHEGLVRSAGTYHALPTAKAAADLDTRCANCGCAAWVSDQGRTVDDTRALAPHAIDLTATD
jgi:hypothetical protein